MSLEILKQIQESENRSQEIRLNAQQEARKIIKGSEIAVIQQEKQASGDHRALYNSLLETNRNEIQKKINSQAPENEKKLRKFQEIARQNIEKATDLIVERIMGNVNR